MLKLAELSFDVCYLPGKENIPADVLSRYQHAREPVDMVAMHDKDDVTLHPCLMDWLRLFAAPHSLSACITALRQAGQNTLHAVPCRKCNMLQLDKVRPERVRKCLHCGNTWTDNQLRWAHPLAGFGP